MEIKNLFQRILDLMEDIDYIEKEQKKVNGQYRFASHDKVTSKIHHLLVKHRINIIPSVESIKQDGNRTDVMLTSTFVNADNPQDSFCIKFPGSGIDAGDKGPGKAISYAFKYTILKAFHLETGDDPDNDADSVYVPAKCLEFDSLISQFPGEEKGMMAFVAECSKNWHKDIEEVKREAVERTVAFTQAYDQWKEKVDVKSDKK